jgi:hypothetical protein
MRGGAAKTVSTQTFDLNYRQYPNLPSYPILRSIDNEIASLCDNFVADLFCDKGPGDFSPIDAVFQLSITFDHLRLATTPTLL